MKKLLPFIFSLCLLSLAVCPLPLEAGPASGKRLDGKQLRSGMIGQTKVQVTKWFGTPSRTNGRDWTYEGLIIHDAESGVTHNVMSVVFTSEEGGTVESVQFLKSY